MAGVDPKWPEAGQKVNMVVHQGLGKVKAQGFGPKGVHRLVLPFTMFLELRNIGGNVLLAYHEEFVDIPMEAHQNAAYRHLAGKLPAELRQALAWRPGPAVRGNRRVAVFFTDS